MGNHLLSPEQSELYGRIETFFFDEDEAAFPFVSRLQRDNGWSRAYAVRAVAEYRKFAFLAVVAGHPVSPSDPIDQVWHLHLLQTRCYWDRFCRQVLGRPLHHEPSKGGKQERDRLGACYAATLESYRFYFGERPPADIWPDTATRFGEHVHFERIDRGRFCVISRSWVTAVMVATVAGLLFFNR